MYFSAVDIITSIICVSLEYYNKNLSNKVRGRLTGVVIKIFIHTYRIHIYIIYILASWEKTLSRDPRKMLRPL